MFRSDVLDDGILAVATLMAAVGVGWLCLDKLRAARTKEGRFRAGPRLDTA
jgi:hypothetical protein